jgi:hypothetical protein
MFENFKNLGNLMRMAGEAKQKMAEVQEELARQQVAGESGGGAVRITMNGKGEVLRVDLDQPLMAGLAGDDKAMVEELIAAAVNDAQQRVRELVAEQLKQVTGGMDVPGLSDMLGGG